MKKIFLLYFVFLCSASVLLAQVPQKFSFQAVATDATGVELAQQMISIRATILSGSSTGSVLYSERFAPMTDEFGLFTLSIGTGANPSGLLSSFSEIPWGTDLFFLKIDMDPAGGTNFVHIGTQQLLSVPYALYAEKANFAATADLAEEAVVAQTAMDDMDRNPTNEIQDILLNGTKLKLTGSNVEVDLGGFGGGTDLDADPTNELQDLEVDGSKIKLTNGTTEVDLAAFNTPDADADPTNELQDLEVNGSKIKLTNGTTEVDLAAFNTPDADADPTNEIQELVLTGSKIKLSGASNEVDLAGFAIPEVDGDPTNEIQDLQLVGSILKLTGSNAEINIANFADADSNPTNELQNLSLKGDTLSLSGGNWVKLNNPAEDFSEPGATIDYPQGFANASFTFIADTFTVPAGQTFYLIAAEDELILPGVGTGFGRHLTGPNMPMFKAGTFIDNCRCIGFLKEVSPKALPTLVVLQPNQANFYSIPSDKNFVIKSGLDNTTPITLNNRTVNFFSGTLKALVIPKGTVIRNIGNDEVILTGYMLEE